MDVMVSTSALKQVSVAAWEGRPRPCLEPTQLKHDEDSDVIFSQGSDDSVSIEARFVRGCGSPVSESMSDSSSGSDFDVVEGLYSMESFDFQGLHSVQTFLGLPEDMYSIESFAGV